jgi:type IV secretory pathway VirJ component
MRFRHFRTGLAVLLTSALAALLGHVVARASGTDADAPPWHPELSGGVVERAPAPGDAVAQDAAASRVLLLSGDGGWTEIEENLSAELVGYGLTVIGVDSRLAFDRDRERAEIARFLERLTGPGTGLIIVGYSFGADLLPIVWPALSHSVRDRAVRVAMIAPSQEGALHVDPTGRYDAAFGPTIPLELNAQHVPLSRLVCIFGVQEKLSGYSSCTNPSLDPAERVELPGGHDLGHNYADIAGAIARPLRLHRHRTAGTASRRLPLQMTGPIREAGQAP